MRSRVARLRRKSNKNKKILLIAILLIFTLVILFTLNLPLFKINKVSTTFSKVSCVAENDLEGDIRITDENIFTISQDKILASIQSKYPCIKQVLLHREFPDGVNLEFVGREAVLALELADLEASSSAFLQLNQVATPSAQATSSARRIDADKFLLDNSGMIFASTKEMVYIPLVLWWNTNIKIGDRLEQKLVGDILKIFDKIKTFNLPFFEIRIYPGGDMWVNVGTIILFNLNKYTDNQLAALQLILDKAKIDDENMLLIDLRFDKPVVKYAPRSK